MTALKNLFLCSVLVSENKKLRPVKGTAVHGQMLAKMNKSKLSLNTNKVGVSTYMDW